MNRQLPFKSAVCTDYENLLFGCQKALESLRARREEIFARNFAKESADELARLHTDYERAYSRLETHEKRCEICQFVSKIGGRNYSSASASASQKKHFA
jgi:hypothetical protein